MSRLPTGFHTPPRHRGAMAAVLLLCLSFIAAPSHAGRYELIKGKGVGVCEAYGTNLNSFKPRLPFRGQRPINPEFKDFSKPDLKGSQEDPSGNRSYPAEKIDRFLWERDVNPAYYFPVVEWPQWRGTREQYAQAWKWYVDVRVRIDPQGERVANLVGNLVGLVDIDNDGILDSVYLDREDNNPGRRGVPLIVLNADRRDINYSKTLLILQHPPRKEQGLGEFRPLMGPENVDHHPHKKYGKTPVEDALMGASYDIFIYKNKTYFDLWWIRHPDYQGRLDFEDGIGKPLRVFTIENGKSREVCTYRYKDTD